MENFEKIEKIKDYLNELKDEYPILSAEIEDVFSKIDEFQDIVRRADEDKRFSEDLHERIIEDSMSDRDILEEICEYWKINCDIKDNLTDGTVDICLEFWCCHDKDCIYEETSESVLAFMEEFDRQDFYSRMQDDISLYAKEHDHINGAPDLEDIIEDCKEEYVTWESLKMEFQKVLRIKEQEKENNLMEETKTYYAYDIDYAYDDDEIDEVISDLDNDEIETIFGFDATEYDDGNELLEEIKNRLYHEPALYDTLFDTQTKLEIPEEVWLQAVSDGDMEVITNYISDTTGFLVNDYKVDEELQDKINESREEQERGL